MANVATKNGYNMYDMLSLMQKAVRRGLFNEAAFAANELDAVFRRVMWNRLIVISSEDCYGILTKEIVRLKKLDDEQKDRKHIANAIALMCKAMKSRDACYFACNFILASRKPRDISVNGDEIEALRNAVDKYSMDNVEAYDSCGFQMTLSDIAPKKENDIETSKIIDAARLQKAIEHLDMDMIGFYMDMFRTKDRDFLWCVLKDFAERKSGCNIIEEIRGLEEADGIVNNNKKMKDEIFISKAVMELCYCIDENIEPIESSSIVKADEFVNWDNYKIKSIDKCKLKGGVIPEWTFDCHTLKGKRMGKTDWDMTVDEQAGLYPKKKAYFDDASWIYTYEDDFKNGDLSERGMIPIREFAKTHEANPVRFIPYD